MAMSNATLVMCCKEGVQARVDGERKDRYGRRGIASLHFVWGLSARTIA